MRGSALALTLVVLCVVVTVVQAGSGSKAQAQEPATPVCPQGSTFNAATGQCETAIGCPPGSTVTNGTCTTVLPCPPGTTGFSASVPMNTTVGCRPSNQRLVCPSGQTVADVETVGGVRVICEGQPNFCAPGFAPTRPGVCTAPPTFTCPPEFALSGTTCLPPATTTTTAAPLIGGTAGDVDARGGDAGSVRGGDGGRGGSGTLPVCNQNTNGFSWEELVQVVDEDGYVVDEYVEIREADPSVDCEAGGRGGSGGDAGIAEAGDGGLAFSVG